MSEQIWYMYPGVLFKAELWSKFVPTKNMTMAETLNAIVRFSIYFSVILYLSTGIAGYLWMVPVTMAVSIIIYNFFPTAEPFFSNIIKQKEYTMPTSENPFMNLMVSDKQPKKQPAPVNRTDVKKETSASFEKTSDIYMDTSDVFDQAQAMRTFHTVPENNLDKFKKWLVKGIDEPDYSSAFPARHGKIHSEGYVSNAPMSGLPNSTEPPSGSSPSTGK